jgi:DNA-directed RNA polymerase specialized sigma54-like protein
MSSHKTSSIQLPASQQLAKMFGQFKLSQIMQLDYKQFEEFIGQIEASDLFKTLTYPRDSAQKNWKVISYVRFPGTRLEKRFYEPTENVIRDRSSVDIEGLLESKNEAIKIIKRLGIEKFESYFLYGEFDLSIEELADKCSLSEGEVWQIIQLVNEIAVQNQFHLHTATFSEGIKYTKIASVYKEAGDFAIGFFDLRLARGRYLINHERLSRLKQEGVFTRGQLRKINKLINILNMINVRNSVIYGLLQIIIKKQRLFFESADERDLDLLTQRQAAKELGVCASWISRLVRYRSIETPWREEVPLRYFFPALKRLRLQIFKAILQEDSSVHSDEHIRQIFKQRYGIYISRRTVTKYRKELSGSVLSKKK